MYCEETMGKLINVKTSIGTFVLAKPKAGPRNRALIAAESDSGHIKQVLFITLLLPTAVSKRPENVDQDVPIEQLLDSLETEDYDALFTAMQDFDKDMNLEPVNQKKESSVTTMNTESPLIQSQ